MSALVKAAATPIRRRRMPDPGRGAAATIMQSRTRRHEKVVISVAHGESENNCAEKQERRRPCGDRHYPRWPPGIYNYTNPSLAVLEWTQDVTSGRRAIASSPQQRADSPTLSHATFAAQRIRRASSLEFASGILIG